MALEFQKQKDRTGRVISELDFSGLASGVSGLVGNAWDKWKTRGDEDELSEEELLKRKQEQELIDDPKTSIASDIGGVLSGAWNRLTGGREEGEVTTEEVVPGFNRDEGQSIESLTDIYKLVRSGGITDYSQVPEHYRANINEDAFNQMAREASTELSPMVTRPDTYAGQDYNSMSGKGPLKNKQGIFGMLTGPFNINKYSQ